MALFVKYDESIEDRVVLSFSETQDICSSIHCLFNPESRKHHISWIKDIEARLPNSLLKELRDFSEISINWNTPTNLMEDGYFLPVEVELSRIRSMDRCTVVDRMRESIEVDTKFFWVTEETNKLKKVMEDNPVKWRDQLCDLLERYHPYFIEAFSWLNARASVEITKLLQLRNNGIKLPELLPMLSSDIAWHKTNRQFILATNYKGTTDLRTINSLYIQPSYFMYPYLGIAPESRNEFNIIYSFKRDSKFKNNDSIDLPALYKAINNSERLEIIRLLSQNEITIDELTEKIDRPKDSVRNSIKALERAGLVEADGCGKSHAFSKYVLKRESVEQMSYFLDEVLVKMAR